MSFVSVKDLHAASEPHIPERTAERTVEPFEGLDLIPAESVGKSIDNLVSSHQDKDSQKKKEVDVVTKHGSESSLKLKQRFESLKSSTNTALEVARQMSSLALAQAPVVTTLQINRNDISDSKKQEATMFKYNIGLMGLKYNG